MTVAQSLTAIVPRQILGCCFLAYKERKTTKIKQEEEHFAVITRADGYLQRQIKNRTLHTSRLFLLAKNRQYTSNWSKAS